MPRIGIITALDKEAATFAVWSSYAQNDHGIQTTLAGPGPDNAVIAAERLLDAGFEVLISWGLAGGLDPALAPGTLVVCERVLTTDDQAIASDVEWTAKLTAKFASLTAVTGTVLSVREPVGASAEKGRLRATFAADVVDMEAAAVSKVATAARVPFAAVKCVVDPADFDLPRAALAAFTSAGVLNVWAMTAHMLRHPVEIPAMLRLGRGYREAIHTLTAAATELEDFANA